MDFPEYSINNYGFGLEGNSRWGRRPEKKETVQKIIDQCDLLIPVTTYETSPTAAVIFANTMQRLRPPCNLGDLALDIFQTYPKKSQEHNFLIEFLKF